MSEPAPTDTTLHSVVRDTIKSFNYLIIRLPEVMLFASAVFIVVVLIGEMSARSALQAQLVEETRDIADFIAKTQGDGPAALSSENTEEYLQIEQRIMAEQRELQVLKEGLKRVRSLQSVGINEGQLKVADISSLYMFADTASVRLSSSESYVSRILGWHSTLSSETLLAIVVCLSGLIGGLISGFRDDITTLHRDIPLGLAAGFVVYLAIKGGKFVFLMQTSDQAFSMNPYGCAFAGLLAGLFTEKAYGLLQSLIEELSDRITHSVRNGDDQPRQSK